MQLWDALRVVYGITCRPRLLLVFLLFFTAAQESHLEWLVGRQTNASEPALHNYGYRPTEAKGIGADAWEHLAYGEDTPSRNSYHRLLSESDDPARFSTLHSTAERERHEELGSPRCKDGYYDHRLQLVCPHLPKSPRSLSKRCQEVLHDFLDSPAWHRLRQPRITPIKRPLPAKRQAHSRPLIGFWKLSALLHSLVAVQLGSLLIETGLVKACGVQPRLATFGPSRSMLKSVRRAVWRLRALQGARLFVEAAVVWVALACYVWHVGRSAWFNEPLFGSTWPTWSIQRPRSDGPWSVAHPLRTIVFLECFCTGLFLSQPVLCVLTGSLIPTFLDVPPSFFDSRTWKRAARCDGRNGPTTEVRVPRGPSVQVETKWLLAVLVETASCTAAIWGYLIVAVSVRALHFPMRSLTLPHRSTPTSATVCLSLSFSPFSPPLRSFVGFRPSEPLPEGPSRACGRS